MSTKPDTQDAVIEWLSEAGAYGQPGAAVERVVTHAAMVFLVGAHAYKMKRAVKYPYLDYSTLALREHNLRRELELNRRTAPALYKRVVPVFRDKDGHFSFEAGEIAEWLLEMARFESGAVFDALARKGALRADLMEPLARRIAAFHAGAQTRFDMGGAARFGRLIEMNAAEFAAGGAFDAARANALTAQSLSLAARLGALMDARRAAGFVRQCHGDLHLGNIVLIGGEPTLFDCIEFSDDIACIDTLYDLAFLLMDLAALGLSAHANRVFNGYIAALPYGDWNAACDGLALLPLYLSCRAAIRAHVAARRAQNGAAGDGERYFALAEMFARPQRPRLVAVGGLSGSGKTTLARHVAPRLAAAPGALVLRTDVIRKRRLGVSETARLPEEAYTREDSARTYDEMLALAGRSLRAGHSVVLDAVFARESERAQARALAHALHVPFDGLWLDVPPSVMEARLAGRAGDASDATADVLRRQLRYDLGVMDWTKVDAAGAPAQAAQAALRALAL